jgi:hypothetical protein
MGGKPVDYAPITDPWLGSINEDCEPIMDKFVKEFRLNANKRENVQFIFTTKSGPNGPALATSLRDAEAITSELEAHLFALSGA